ncbi:MAG: PTS transporter subunit EIIC [Selenomonas sp.]|nr:PTS transporter subunit EIIC [Selenomonas sp.]
MTENEQIASGVLAALENSGGRPSLLRAYNCMTRLRLSFDEVAGIPDGLADAVAGLPSVLGTNVSGTELQIILGPGKAANVTAALNKLLAASKPAAPSEKEAPADDRPQIGDGKALHAKIRAKNATPVKLFFKRIASIFIPLIPGFIACGLISGCLNVVAKVAPDVTTGPLFQLLAIAGSTVFFGMNLLVGRNTMEEFGGTPVLGAILGASLSHPNLAHVTLNGETLVPGRGGIISVLLVAMLASVIEKQVKRFVPEALSLFVTPLVTFLVSGTIAILVLQPVGGALSDLIGNTATGAIAAGGALTGAVLGGTFLPMVMLGIHQTLTPIHAELLARYGVTILLPVLAMAGAGQVGASFAVWCRTKNTRLKKIIASALPVGILGIGEPLIYGVTLPLGRPFLGACIGGACGGAVQAAFGVGAATLGISGLPLAAATDNIPIYLLGLVCAYIGGFVATLVIGFDDPVETANADSSSERV